MAEQTRPRHLTGARRRNAQRQPFDRRELERRGWRTTLEYRENNERDASGLLGVVTPQWSAEGEYVDAEGGVSVVVARAPSPAAAWRRLRAAVETSRGSTTSREAASR